MRGLDDRPLFRIRFKVDTISGILPAVWHSHDSLMRRLFVGQGILDSLADDLAFLLAHTNARMLSTSTPLAVQVSNGSATRRKDHVPKYELNNSLRCFAALVSRPSVITSHPSASPVVRRRAGMPCCQTPQAITKWSRTADGISPGT